MTSSSSFGCSLITLQFVLDLNIDVAEQEVQAAINGASNLLPQGLPNPPIYSKINPADAPILTLALASDSLPLSKVEDLADTAFAQKISQLSGVGLVSISGGQRPAVRIQDRKSTRLNSSHGYISYAVLCLNKKGDQGRAARARLRDDALQDGAPAAPHGRDDTEVTRRPRAERRRVAPQRDQRDEHLRSNAD